MLSIIIPTTPKPSLYKLIESIKEQKGDIRYEIILGLEGRNPAEIRNKAREKAKGSTLLFLDDDLVLKNDFLVKGYTKFSSTQAKIGQSKVIGGINNSPDIFISAACWFDATAFDNLFGFDIDFFYNEDIDIFLRAQENNFKYVYLKNSVAWHPELGNFEKLKENNELLKHKHPKFYATLVKEIR